MTRWRSSGSNVRSPNTRIHTPCFSRFSLQLKKKEKNKTHTAGLLTCSHIQEDPVFIPCRQTHFSSSSRRNFSLASSSKPSTSCLERLKFSMLKAYTVTSWMPRFRHQRSVWGKQTNTINIRKMSVCSWLVAHPRPHSPSGHTEPPSRTLSTGCLYFIYFFTIFQSHGPLYVFSGNSFFPLSLIFFPFPLPLSYLLEI